MDTRNLYSKIGLVKDSDIRIFTSIYANRKRGKKDEKITLWNK